MMGLCVVRRGVAALVSLCAASCGADIRFTGPSLRVRISPSGGVDGVPATAERPRLVAKTPEGGEVLEFPLQHTSVRTEISGNVARVEMQQVFENPLTERLEAVYTFPLPDNAAVTDMFFRIGRRIVYGEVRTRAEAVATYESAKRAGRAAALTEEDRPNVFTQRLANVAPGESIVVTIRYVHEVPFDDGRYVYALPTTIGPRYVPGAPLPKPAAGSGTSPDTDEVPDGSRVTPPVVAPPDRSSREVDVEVRLHPPAAFADLRSRNHALDMTESGGALVVSLAGTPEDRIPNRDFVLEYAPAGGDPEPFLLCGTQLDDEYVMLFVQPPPAPDEGTVRPREVIFLVDVSGSMAGYPLATAKGVVARALEGLRADDTFQIIAFAGAAMPMSPEPLAPTDENVARGLTDLDRLHGGGGTEMMAGVRAALSPPAEPHRLRIVVFLTDGNIGNEAAVIAAVGELRGSTRVMGFGIGSSPNRYLIDGVAEAGRGAADYVALGDDPGEATERLYRRLDRPLLTDIELDWNGAEPEDVHPARVPDLFAGQPLVVVAKMSRGAAAPAGVTVRGRLGLEPYERTVAATRLDDPGDEPVLGTLWARRKIRHHETDTPGHAVEVDAITALGLRFKLVTPYTSFVAVDRDLPADLDLPLRSVTIPTDLPEGTRSEDIVAMKGVPAREYAYAPRHRGAEAAMGKRSADAYYGLKGGASLDALKSAGMLGLARTSAGMLGLDYGGPETVGRGGGDGSGSGYGTAFGAGTASWAGPSTGAPAAIAGAPVIRGALDKEVVRSVIRKHNAELKFCYEKELARAPGLAGKLVVAFAIAPTGKVARVRIDTSTLGNDAVGACVVETILRLVFPAASGDTGVEVTYPFAFTPGAP